MDALTGALNGRTSRTINPTSQRNMKKTHRPSHTRGVFAMTPLAVTSSQAVFRRKDRERSIASKAAGAGAGGFVL